MPTCGQKGLVSLETFNPAGADRSRYTLAGWSTLPRVLRVGEVTGNDTFIDYGSGMGRIGYQAAQRYPPGRVIGVQLSDALNQIAWSNIERNRHRLRCQDVTLLTADALEWDPSLDITVALFGNPFTGSLFEAVVDRLLNSSERAGRPLRIIYFNPVEHDWLMATGRLEVVRRLPGWGPDPAWSTSNMTVMYEYVPSGGQETS